MKAAIRRFRMKSKAGKNVTTGQSMPSQPPISNACEREANGCEVMMTQPEIASDSQSYTPDILIRTPTGRYVVAAAALDTQCQDGNWISERLVKRLGMTNAVDKDGKRAQCLTATGEVFESGGVLKFDWKLASNECRMFTSECYVLPNAEHFDVILGRKTITEERLVSLNPSKLVAVLTTLKPLTKEEKSAIVTQEARQNKEKQELEARRQAKQQQQSSAQSSVQQQH